MRASWNQTGSAAIALAAGDRENRSRRGSGAASSLRIGAVKGVVFRGAKRNVAIGCACDAATAAAGPNKDEALLPTVRLDPLRRAFALEMMSVPPVTIVPWL